MVGGVGHSRDLFADVNEMSLIAEEAAAAGEGTGVPMCVPDPSHTCRPGTALPKCPIMYRWSKEVLGHLLVTSPTPPTSYLLDLTPPPPFLDVGRSQAVVTRGKWLW